MVEKVYEPEIIQDNPFPGEVVQPIVTAVASGGTGGNYSPSTTKPTLFPTRKIATELMSVALNTRSKRILQEFELGQSGGIKVGDYQNGISGDLRITPNGLTARDMAGITTFAIDGITGDAVFKGIIQAGTLVSGLVVVGDNRVIIDGENQTIVVNDGTYDRVLIGYGDF